VAAREAARAGQYGLSNPAQSRRFAWKALLLGEILVGMSGENVDLVRQGIENVEAFWAMLDEEVVWDLRARPFADLDPIYIGRDAVIKASRHYWGTWQEYQLEAEEVIDGGAKIVVAVHERVRGRNSGVPLESHFVQVWTFDEGRVVRWEIFAEKAAALEAAGLPE
jgi:ketosteroid isomerase-like protein